MASCGSPRRSSPSRSRLRPSAPRISCRLRLRSFQYLPPQAHVMRLWWSTLVSVEVRPATRAATMLEFASPETVRRCGVHWRKFDNKSGSSCWWCSTIPKSRSAAQSLSGCAALAALYSSCCTDGFHIAVPLGDVTHYPSSMRLGFDQAVEDSFWKVSSRRAQRWCARALSRSATCRVTNPSLRLEPEARPCLAAGTRCGQR